MLNPKIHVVRAGVNAGRGLVALESIKAGEIVWEVLPGDIVSRADARQKMSENEGVVYSQVGLNRYALNQPDDWFMNHSCEPNALLCEERFIAARDISAGDEITYDYGVTEISETWAFECSCQSDSCRQYVSNLDYLDPDLIRKNPSQVPEHTRLLAEQASDWLKARYRFKKYLFLNWPLVGTNWDSRRVWSTARWKGMLSRLFLGSPVIEQTYQMFGIWVKSQLAFEALAPNQDAQHEWVLKRKWVWRLAKHKQWLESWVSGNRPNEPAMSVSRQDEFIRFRMHDFAEFLIDPVNHSIELKQRFDVSDHIASMVFQDQVLPRIIGSYEDVVIHASAVASDRFTGIAFAGNSGWGKSTLATYFAQQGYTCVSDDCLKLQVKDDGLVGSSSKHGMRLALDSLNEFQLTRDSNVLHVHPDHKHRVSAPYSPGKSRLRIGVIFFVQAPEQSWDNKIWIEPVSGSESLIELTRRSFLLTSEKQMLAGQFERFRGIAESGVLMYRLWFPRRFDRLEDVKTAIENTLVQAGAEQDRSAAVVHE